MQLLLEVDDLRGVMHWKVMAVWAKTGWMLGAVQWRYSNIVDDSAFLFLERCFEIDPF